MTAANPDGDGRTNAGPNARALHVPSHPARTVVAVVVVVLLSIVIIALASRVGDDDLKRALYTGAATLLFGGLLGTLLKILIEDAAGARLRREDAATFVANVLADLKAVYDRVGRARIVIPAHQSVKTYGEEMRDLIEARVQLKNVVRALEHRGDGVSRITRDAVTADTRKMEDYLDTLMSEFRSKYKKLSDLQRAYEAKATTLAKRFAADKRDDASPPELRPFPWEELLRLPVIADFVGTGSKYDEGFETPLDHASETLRAELARILGRA